MQGVRDASHGFVALVQRLRSGAVYVTFAFVIASLVTLAVVPILGFRQTLAYQHSIAAEIEPARRAVTNIHLALAIEADALSELRQRGDSAAIERYGRHVERHDEMVAQLESLAPRLGPDVAQRLVTLRTAAAEWHAVARALLPSQTSGSADGSASPTEHERRRRYEDVLLAAARVDEAIAGVAQERQSVVSRRERRQVGTMAVFALNALAAALAVGWIGHRLRRAAAEAEAGRTHIERLMESRARLMRGVTHDLRNPLQVISGHAGLLRDGVGGSLAPEQRRSVDHIGRGARSLLRLIDDLTELGQLDAGELAVRREPTDPVALGRTVADAYRPIIEQQGLQLVVELPAALPMLLTDRHRVRHVLANLLSNAAKYTPAGGIVAVSAMPRTAPAAPRRQRWLTVVVSDTGRGIPPDKLEAIFDEFVRLDPSAASGSGLGLAVSRRVARILGGDLTVTSEIGRGATFTVWLPVDAPSIEAERRVDSVGAERIVRGDRPAVQLAARDAEPLKAARTTAYHGPTAGAVNSVQVGGSMV